MCQKGRTVLCSGFEQLAEDMYGWFLSNWTDLLVIVPPKVTFFWNLLGIDFYMDS